MLRGWARLDLIDTWKKIKMLILKVFANGDKHVLSLLTAYYSYKLKTS